MFSLPVGEDGRLEAGVQAEVLADVTGDVSRNVARAAQADCACLSILRTCAHILHIL